MSMGDAPSKFDVRQTIHGHIMAAVDEDIRQIFERHGYAVEPLLMQVIRELQAIKDIVGNMAKELR